MCAVICADCKDCTAHTSKGQNVARALIGDVTWSPPDQDSPEVRSRHRLGGRSGGGICDIVP